MDALQQQSQIRLQSTIFLYDVDIGAQGIHHVP
jgi:hypothetical protein